MAKATLIGGLLIFVGAAGWKIGGNLSSDALGMALGILFGVMAGIPAALMVLATGQRERRYHDIYRPQQQHREATPQPTPPQQIHVHYHGSGRQERAAESPRQHMVRWSVVGQDDSEQ